MNSIKKGDLPKIIFLMGPTASGKTTLAIKLRDILPVELINVDSALIYKGMDIGTSKPNAEELLKAPHRLLNILDPTQIYSAANFRYDALSEITKIISLNRIPLLVGGTMLYYKVLIDGLSYLPPANLEIRAKIKQWMIKCKERNILHQQLMSIDPIAAIRIHPNDLQRISRALEVFFVSGKTLTELIQNKKRHILPYNIYQFAISPTNRNILNKRIEQRFYQMLTSGFEEEMQILFARKDLHKDMPSMRCVGYRQMWSWLENKISYKEMIYLSICATKQLAKRQMTWLRKWKGLHWLDSENPQQALKEIYRKLSS